MLTEIWQSSRWIFSLGYVTVISIIATILLVKLWRVTILKKTLLNTTPTQKDSILGFAGTITSLVVFILVHFANEMIIQRKFKIDFNTVIQAISIPSGAAIVWSASKGVYTVFHKWWQRVKSGEKFSWKKASAELEAETKNPTLSLSAAMDSKPSRKRKKDKAPVKVVINRRTGE